MCGGQLVEKFQRWSGVGQSGGHFFGRVRGVVTCYNPFPNSVQARKMASSSSRPEHPGPTDSEQPLQANRGVMNTKIFASFFESCLLETIATNSEDFMDPPVDTTQQLNILKTLSKKFQSEIKSIHEDSSRCRRQQLTGAIKTPGARRK